MTFDIRDYLDQLEPHPETKGAYLCPACGTGKLTIGKGNSKYSCWAGCDRKGIREALSPACNPNSGLTQAEREERRQAAAAQREQQALETVRAYDAAAVRARRVWDAAVPLTEADPQLVADSYWTLKGLKSLTAADARMGLKGQYRGVLLFAVRRSDGTLRSLQRCYPDGEKKNFFGGDMKGGAGLIGDLTDAAVVAIAEGPATAGSIHQLTGWPVLIGFSTSGLPYAAAIARALAPNARLVFCADNDRSKAGEKAAAPLAKEYGAVVVMPPARPDDRKTWDFNDMHQGEGDDATRELLLSALEAEPAAPEVPDADSADEQQDAAPAPDESSSDAPDGDEDVLPDLGEATAQLKVLCRTHRTKELVALVDELVTVTADMEDREADAWLKAIAKAAGLTVDGLRQQRGFILCARASAKIAERQAKLESAQKQALKAGKLDPRMADRYIPIRLRDTDAGLDLFEDEGWLTLGPNADLGLATMRSRQLHLCWDADVFDPQVLDRLKAKAIALADTGAEIRVEVLPRCPETGRALTAAETAERYGKSFLGRLPKLARNCWKEVQNGGKDFHLEPDAEDTVQRSGYVVGMIGDRLVADPELSQAWLSYTGTHWELHPHDKDIRGQVQALADAQGWVKGREFGAFNSLFADVTRTLTRRLPLCQTGLVPLRNGLLELKTRQLLPHSPEYGNRWSLPYDYDPEATAEPIVEFLAERLGGSDRLRLLRAWLALLLRGIRPKQFVELVGESDTGKSTICNLISALLGTENTVSADLQRLEDKHNRFETYRLRGKRLVIIPEAHKYSGSLEVLKSLTGGDLISAEIKGSTGVADFYFEGGVVVAGNGFLYASDSSDAVMKRRMPFTLGRVTGPRRSLLQWNTSRRGWEGEFVPMLPGLFNWALSMDEAEARQVLDNRHQIPALRQQDYENLIDQDPLLAWADANLIAVPGSNLRIGDIEGEASLYAFPNYRRHCEKQGVRRPLTQHTFRKTLVSRLRSLGADLPDDEQAYRVRGQGAVIPGIGLRQPGDTTSASLIQSLMLSDPEPTDAERFGTDSGTDRNDSGTVETQSGHGRNGCNGFSLLTRIEASERNTQESEEGVDNDRPDQGDSVYVSESTPIGRCGQKTVPSVPSSPRKGSGDRLTVPGTVPEPFPTVPDAANPWGLTSEQVAIALGILQAEPGISDLSFEVKLSRANIRIPTSQLKAFRQWLDGGAA